jgi:CMP-N-acetylneuraminic acid synthetase
MPLFVHSIKIAAEIKNISEVFLLTNNSWYADIARLYGAKVPYLRSKDSSSDYARDNLVIREFFERQSVIKAHHNPLIIWLRPTHPFRQAEILNKLVSNFATSNFCSARSISVSKQTPYKMWSITDNGALTRVVGEQGDDLHNAPRQNIPKTYWQNGYLDIFYPCYIQKQTCRIHIGKIGPLLLDESDFLDVDLDYPEDFINAEKIGLKIINRSSKAQKLGNRFIGGIDHKRYGS